MKITHKKAFSLVELSIVILIVSVLIGGSLTILKLMTDSAKEDLTKERMDIIYKAITDFVAINRRIPCPASSFVLKEAAAYGSEATTPGTCTGSFKSTTNAPNLAWGMVPIKALGLHPEMAEDGFGTRFSYVVDMRFTLASVSTSSSSGFEITKSLRAESDSATVDLSGIRPVMRTSTTAEVDFLPNKNGILTIISHGANKSKGFSPHSIVINSSYDADDELANGCDENLGVCSGSGTTSFWRRRYVSTTQANFDDIVLFKNKTQLVKDAGLEFIMCNGNEADTTTTYTACASTPTNNLSWTTPSLKNAYYGDKAYSNGMECARRCGKYGIWERATPTSSSGISINKSLNYQAGNGGTSQILGSVFTYNGGTLLIICHGSGWRSSSTPALLVQVSVANSAGSSNIETPGGLTLGAAISINAHISMVSRAFVISPGSNLVPGTQYRMRIEPISGTFDSNDRFDFAVIEFPLI